MAADIKLCYFGGSGGFVSLHLLLLSGKFICDFGINMDMDKIISHQWSIDDAALWKSHETWPQNGKTRTLQTTLRKIYFFCNPDLEGISKFEGITIFLYTDMRSQLFLARYKRAHSFYRPKNYVSYYRAQLKNWISHYENNKDPSWPMCFGPRGFKRLPIWIREELLLKTHTSDRLDIFRFAVNEQEMNLRMNYLLSSGNFKILPDGSKVLPEVFNFFPSADLTIRLQDMINDLDILSNLTGTPVNDSQEALRSHWISLHSPELLREIGINLL